VKTSRRPLVLTQRGHSAAVVLDVAEYERMVEEIDLLSDVRTAMHQLQSGQAVSNRDANTELRKRFSR
jgi:antitoxin YefM